MHATAFIAVRIVLLAVAVLVVPLPGETQQAASLPRIGFLAAASLSDPRIPPIVQAFRQGLRELGYVEGQNIAVEFRWAEGQYGRLPGLAGRVGPSQGERHRGKWSAGDPGGKASDRDDPHRLEFIARYIRRYGISPAESDIGRHFLVSAPSVNQMVQMLERQGFIARQRRVPRSIRIIDHPQPLRPMMKTLR